MTENGQILEIKLSVFGWLPVKRSKSQKHYFYFLGTYSYYDWSSCSNKILGWFRLWRKWLALAWWFASQRRGYVSVFTFWLRVTKYRSPKNDFVVFCWGFPFLKFWLIIAHFGSFYETVMKSGFLISIGNPKSACLHFYTAKTQAALALPFLPYSTLRVEQCFDSGYLSL